MILLMSTPLVVTLTSLRPSWITRSRLWPRRPSQTGDTDFSAQLTRIAEANPEVIFVSAIADEIPQILSQGREIGISASTPFIVTDLTGAEIEKAAAACRGARLPLRIGPA